MSQVSWRSLTIDTHYEQRRSSIYNHVSEKGVEPDGLFLTVGANAGTRGAVGGVNATLIYEKRTGSVWLLGNVEGGTSPITLLKNHKTGRSLVFGAMFNMNHPSDFSGLGFTATWPIVAFSSVDRFTRFAKTVLPGSAFNWYRWIANRNTRPGVIADTINPNYGKLGVIQFGYSTSGASFVGFGFRDNSFSATIGWATPTVELVHDVPEKIMSFFRGDHQDLESLINAADAIDFSQ